MGIVAFFGGISKLSALSSSTAPTEGRARSGIYIVNQFKPSVSTPPTPLLLDTHIFLLKNCSDSRRRAPYGPKEGVWASLFLVCKFKDYFLFIVSFIIFPSCITIVRSPIAAYSGSCVTIMIVCPSLLRSRNTSST